MDRSKLWQQYQEALQTGDHFAELEAVSLLAAADLRYPVNAKGDVIQVAHLGAPLGDFLAKRGWRWDRNKALIKPRKVYGPGVFEDAETWVDVSAPDDPLENLHHMSIIQIEALPEDLKGEAKRRLGWKTQDPQPQPGWAQRNTITVNDEEKL